jgi:hypothetical protein
MWRIYSNPDPHREISFGLSIIITYILISDIRMYIKKYTSKLSPKGALQNAFNSVRKDQLSIKKAALW